MEKPKCVMTVTFDNALKETIKALFVHGPLFDGDVPSKIARDRAVTVGLVVRYNGYQTLTADGLAAALYFGFDRDKEKYNRLLREQRG